MEKKHSFIHLIPEWGRYLAERWLVVPAAAYLPKSWAMGVADAVGLVEAHMPIAGTRVARREMRAAGISERELAAAVSEHLSWIRRNLVYAKRMRTGREHPREWNIREVNGEAVHALRDAGRPLLVVTGHFIDTASTAMNTMVFTELAGRGLSAVTPDFSWSPFVLRTRLYNGLQYDLGRFLVDHENDRLLPPVGTHGVFARTVAQLRSGSGMAKLLADAFWEKDGAYQRPFAGIRQRGFALGAARIARAAQCHVVTYAAIFEGPAAIKIEWSVPHAPPAADDEAGDEAFMDVLIDELELLVGRHPRQYVHPMGTRRSWDAATERWTDSPR